PVTSIHLLEPLLSQGNQSRPLLAIRQLHFHTRARLRITTRLPLSCATAEHCTIAERHRDITPAPETRYRSWEEGPSPPQRPPVWMAATRRDFVLAACRFLKQWRDALHRARESSARRARSPSDVAPRLRRHDENQGQRGASTGVVDWSRRLESSTGVVDGGVDWSRRRGASSRRPPAPCSRRRVSPRLCHRTAALERLTPPPPGAIAGACGPLERPRR